jgi:hypothetical protein
LISIEIILNGNSSQNATVHDIHGCILIYW